MLRRNGLGQRRRHRGVFEKRPCIAQDVGIRELRLANANDRLADVTVRATIVGYGRQFLLQGAVTHDQRAFPVEVKSHPDNGPFSPFVSLEDALAVAKFTTGRVKPLQGPVGDAHGFEPRKPILDFHPVGTDVLHRARTDVSRNQRQVFKAAPSLFQRSHDKGMPAFASPCGHRQPPSVVFDHLHATHGQVNDQGLHVRVKKHVASATQHHDVHPLVRRPGQGLAQGIHARHLGVPPRLRGNPKGRQGGQIDVVLDGHRLTQS